MTLTNFKARVAAYLNRDATLFVSGGVDNIVEAINDVRRQAQQQHVFYSLRRFAFVKVHGCGVEWKTAMVDVPEDTGGQVMVRHVNRVWTFGTSGDVYTPAVPVRIGVPADITRGRDSVAVAEDVDSSAYSAPTMVYLLGNKMYFPGFEDDTWLMCEVVEQLPDLTTSSVSDVFLDEYSNWTLLAVIQNLNAFLKEDQRVAISDAAMKRAWDAVLTYDSQQETAGGWTSLD